MKHKHCGSFREFIKIVRKYRKWHWRHRNPHVIDYDWVFYDVTCPSQIDEIKRHTKCCSPGLSMFLDRMKEMKGRRVMIDWKEQTGTVIGLQITNSDYYYIIRRDSDGGTTYQSCIGHIRLVDEENEQNEK